MRLRFFRGRESLIFTDPDNRPTTDPETLRLRAKEAGQISNPQAHARLSETPVGYYLLDPKDATGFQGAVRLLKMADRELDQQNGRHTIEELARGVGDGDYRIAVARRNLGFVGVALSKPNEMGEEPAEWYVQPAMRNQGIGKRLLIELGVVPLAEIEAPATLELVELSTDSTPEETAVA